MPDKLTPQEQYLYNMHRRNLTGSGGVTNPDGSRSTLKQITVGIGDKTYNLPTVWDGKILSPADAIARAKQDGLDKYPSYDTQKEAEDRYQQMHVQMQQDVQQSQGPPPYPINQESSPSSTGYKKGGAVEVPYKKPKWRRW